MSESAPAILDVLRGRGIEVVPAGEAIKFRPKDSLSDEELAALSRDRGSILSALYGERAKASARGGIKATNSELTDIERQVSDVGWVLIWSSVLEDLVAFCRTEEDAVSVPRGVVVYTVDELSILFGDDPGGPGEAGLRLIHEAKRIGGGIIKTEGPEE